jgi:hypothetical protein
MRQANPFSGQRIHVRGLDNRVSVEPGVSIPRIIRHYQNDIGPLFRRTDRYGSDA